METCYNSRIMHVTTGSETVFQNYLYWPYDICLVGRETFIIQEQLKAFYSLVFAARIINRVFGKRKVDFKKIFPKTK